MVWYSLFEPATNITSYVIPGFCWNFKEFTPFSRKSLIKTWEKDSKVIVCKTWTKVSYIQNTSNKNYFVIISIFRSQTLSPWIFFEGPLPLHKCFHILKVSFYVLIPHIYCILLNTSTNFLNLQYFITSIPQFNEL